MRVLEVLAEIPQEIKDRLTPLDHGDTAVARDNLINVIFYVVGLLSVVMIIVAGIQMATSAGDSSAVAKAKKTMTYAIVGLVVTLLAYAIVNFVVAKL